MLVELQRALLQHCRIQSEALFDQLRVDRFDDGIAAECRALVKHPECSLPNVFVFEDACIQKADWHNDVENDLVRATLADEMCDGVARSLAEPVMCCPEGIRRNNETFLE